MLELVTGGSGSGKSEYAEHLAVKAHRKNPEGTLYYVATMYPSDEECLGRIGRHRRMREKKGFVTVECYIGLEKIKPAGKDVILLECMSNLLANEMFGQEGRLLGKTGNPLRNPVEFPVRDPAEDRLREFVLAPLFTLAKEAAHLVVVTNEVFSDGTAYEEETLAYVRLLGKANCEIGRKADTVTEVVCGIPVIRKGEALCCVH